MKAIKITTTEQATSILISPGYRLYARVPGRNDSELVLPECIRETPAGLQANVGEYEYLYGRIENEEEGTWEPTYGYRMLSTEWVIPSLIYAKHQCTDCHYPPDMCCMQSLKDSDIAWQNYEESFNPGFEYESIEL